MRNSFETVKRSHQFRHDVEGLKRYYGEWAGRYNADLASECWVAPQVTCEVVRLVVAGYSSIGASVLDAGCGTGLVGIGLRRLGFESVDGVDLSEQMVQQAFETGAYRQLRGGVDLNKRPPAQEAGRYGIVVSSGMFTHGHVEPAALLSLIDYCERGGFVVVSTRNSYMVKTAFEQFVEHEVLSPEVELRFRVRDARYLEEEGAHYWVFHRKPA
jgi:2-polyprenyl-3-methyl-5-hydroxy-6-metoxy-1,4-benzoquinol methylase